MSDFFGSAKPIQQIFGFSWPRWVFAGLMVVVCAFGGCSRPRGSVFQSVHFPQARVEVFTLSELETRATCEYWDVCLYEKYEELRAFGANRFYEQKSKYIPKSPYRFGEYERLKSFSYTPEP